MAEADQEPDDWNEDTGWQEGVQKASRFFVCWYFDKNPIQV